MTKKLLLMCAVLLLLAAGATRSFAQAPQMVDLGFNVNGTYIDLGTDATFAGDAGALGISFAGYNTPSGLGSIQLTYNPGVAGTFFFDTLIAEEVGTPAENEFGCTSLDSPCGSHTGAVGSESWEIGNYNNFNAGVGTGDIFNDVQGAASDTLQNTDYLPVAGSNYLNNCLTLTGCNGQGTIALGDTFALALGQEEIVTVTASLSNPGGFYLAQTNPADGNNGGNPTTVYFSLTAQEQAAGSGPPPVIPEPSSWLLLATGLLGVGMTQVRRKYSAQGVL